VRGCRELELRGIPPGMFPETDYESQTVQLERGDSVIFLSDGFSESQNSTGDFFGMEKVQEVCVPAEKNTGGNPSPNDGGSDPLFLRPAATR